MKKSFKVYIALTSRGNLYTGIALDPEKRIKQHNAGKGAKALRGQLPVKLLRASEPMTHSEALSLEYQIKQLTPAQKRRWAEGKDHE